MFGLTAGEHRVNIFPDLGAELESREAEQLVPTPDHILDPLGTPGQSLLPGGVSNPDPGLTHVCEIEGTRGRVLEVADQLIEQPGLLGVSDSLVSLDSHGRTDDGAPREVRDRDL